MSDLIDRKQAIDAIVNRTVTVDTDAQWLSGHARCELEIIDIINALPSAQPEPQWISCKERMPNKDGVYLVSGRWASGKESVGDCDYSKEDGYFHTAWNFDVLAWMPLPEPYRERREE